MRLVAKRVSVAAGLLAIALSSVATGAQAHDDDRGWKKHRRHYAPVYVLTPARPVYYYAAPLVVYAPPLVVHYPPPAAPSLNIHIPLR